MSFAFTCDAKDGLARTGALDTPRGKIRTPAFMPVGTAATAISFAYVDDRTQTIGGDGADTGRDGGTQRSTSGSYLADRAYRVAQGIGGLTHGGQARGLDISAPRRPC